MQSILRASIAAASRSAQRLASRDADGPFLLLARPFFSGSGKSSVESEKNAEKLLELMSKSTAMQSMMLQALPPAARNPEVIQTMLKDPAMKQKLVKMIASMNLRIPSHVLQGMNAASMDETFSRARKMGVDPQAVFAKLQAHPHLLAKLQDPKVMEAFTRISQNPSATIHVDPETLAVIQEIRQALGQDTTPTSPTSPTSTNEPQPPLRSAVTTNHPEADGAHSPGINPAHTPPADPSLTPPPPRMISPDQHPTPTLPAPPIDLGSSQGAINMSRLISLDPELSRRVSGSPKVLKAIQVIAKSPWKTILYIWDKEVMECFTALNNLMKGKDAWGRKT